MEWTNNMSHRILKTLGLIALLVFLTGVAQAGDWPMFHHDARHTGYTTEKVPDELELLWSYTTGGYVSTSPAVADGKVFVGSDDKKIYCIDEDTGSFIWSYTTGDRVYSSPAVADGKVFIGSYDGKIYCLDEDTGSFIWSYTTGSSVHSSPAVADGKVFVGSSDKKIYCLDEDTGKLIWSYTTENYLSLSPAVADGKVFVGSYDKKIYCLDEDTGSFIWSYTTGDHVPSLPAVADGKVFVGSWDGKIYCLDEDTGSFIWSYTTGGGVYTSPAVADGKVFVGSSGKIYYLDKDTGSFIWNCTTGIGGPSSPAVADGKVFVGSSDRKIYCFGAKVKPTAPPPNNPPNTPSIPSGDSSGYAGTTYTYSTSATDPDGDRVQYRFDWNDGTISSWTSFVSSGSSAYESHSWSGAGAYYVTAQARDTQGATSSWSSAKTVTVSATPTPTPTPECKILWYFDEESVKCQQEQFCGIYMYKGLRTFETEEECKAMLEEYLKEKKEEVPTPTPAPATPTPTPTSTPMPASATPTPTLPPVMPISPEYLYLIPIALFLILLPFIFYIREKKKKSPTTSEKPSLSPEQKEQEQITPPISEPITIERAIYDPCKRDFIERALPRMKEWVNSHDPGAYWFAMSIQNNTDKAIDEWGVELETSSALKVEKAIIEGMEYKIELREIHPEPYKNKYAIGVPKEYGVVIPKGGAQRVYFKLHTDKPKTTYEISGVFKSEITGDVPIRAKEFKYLCDTGVSPEAVKVELKKTFSEKDAARLANTFRIVQEIRSSYCNTGTTAREINKEFDLLKMYFTEKEFLDEVEGIQRRMNAELREDERLSEKHVEEVKDFCEKFTEMWIAKFLR